MAEWAGVLLAVVGAVLGSWAAVNISVAELRRDVAHLSESLKLFREDFGKDLEKVETQINKRADAHSERISKIQSFLMGEQSRKGTSGEHSAWVNDAKR